MVIFRIIILIFLICFNVSVLCADEITEGNIQLVVNEKTGGFSLYYRAKPNLKRFEPLFNTDQSATFATVSIDGSAYRLSDKTFRLKFEKQNEYPAFIYESSIVKVVQIFTPVITKNSSEINGIKISYTILNTSAKDSLIGFRFLLDTALGEGIGKTPFSTSVSNKITNETHVNNPAETKYWISKNNKASLMGSIVNPLDSTQKKPDSVYFAGWKRFFDVPWMINFSQGRSLSGDSAVCYYYEPVQLAAGDSFTYSIYLTAEDTDWYYITSIVTGEDTIETANELVSEAENTESNFIEAVFLSETQVIFPEENLSISIPQEVHKNLLILLELQEILNQFINGEIELDEYNLNEIENAISKYR